MTIRDGMDNRGFSLMEVLVCVAVLAVICIPILKGFETSSWYTRKAYETQSVTAYMQQVTESVQHESQEAVQNKILAAGGSLSTAVDEVRKGEFPESVPGTIYPEELFTVTTCTLEDITIAGRSYDLNVVYDPLAYSGTKAASEIPLETGAQDTNVYTFADIGSVDGMKYPVISDEVSRYEGTEGTGSAVLYNLMSKMTEAERAAWTSGGTGYTEETLLKKLYENTGKQIRVNISQYGTAASPSVRVNCDVIYECVWPRPITVSYNVYQANYSLTEEKDAAGNFIGWRQGGKVWLFVKAWQEQSYGSAMPRYNKIDIQTSLESTLPPIEVCLVRGYYYRMDSAEEGKIADRSGLHFDEVTLDGHIYAQMSSPNVLTGEFSAGQVSLHTNIKGQMTGRQLMVGDFEATVGMERAGLRCCEVTMTLTDRESGGTAARIVTTKEVRE